jgi:hypothetical protein
VTPPRVTETTGDPSQCLTIIVNLINIKEGRGRAEGMAGRRVLRLLKRARERSQAKTVEKASQVGGFGRSHSYNMSRLIDSNTIMNETLAQVLLIPMVQLPDD